MDLLVLDGIYKMGYGIVPKLVMCSDLPRDAKVIYAYICSYAGSGTTAFPGVDTIRSHLKISKDAFYKNMEILKDEGYISVKPTYEVGTGKFMHNIYEINIHPTPISDEERAIKAAKAAAKAAKSKSKKEPCPVQQDTAKEPCPVEQDTVKEPCPVQQDTAKGPCPVQQDTAKGPCPVQQDTAKICADETKKSPILQGDLVESLQEAEKEPCPVQQDTNNNILLNNSSSTTRFYKNTDELKTCQEHKEKNILKQICWDFLGIDLLPGIEKELLGYMQGENPLSLEVIELSIKETAAAPKPSIKYLRSILDRCKTQGICTRDQWETDKLTHTSSQIKEGLPTFLRTYSHDFDLEALQAKEYELLQSKHGAIS